MTAPLMIMVSVPARGAIVSVVTDGMAMGAVIQRVYEMANDVPDGTGFNIVSATWLAGAWHEGVKHCMWLKVRGALMPLDNKTAQAVRDNQPQTPDGAGATK